MGKLFFYLYNIIAILIGILLSPVVLIPFLFYFGELNLYSIPMIIILAFVAYAFISGAFKSINEGYVLKIGDGFSIPYK